MADVLVLVAAGAVALAAAGLLAHRLRLPPALGYLAVGLVASPALANTPSLPMEPVEAAAKVAVLALLFFIGLELDLKRLRETLQGTVTVTILNILLPGLAVAGVGRLFGWSIPASLALGICLSVSSTIFGERLSSTAAFGALARRRVLGILLAEDVGAAGLLALMVLLGGGIEGGGTWLGPATAIARLVVILVIMTAAAIVVVPRIIDAVARTHLHELLVLASAAIVVAFGLMGFYAGSAELGAFVAGVACAEAGSRFVVRNGLQSLRDISLGIFFLAAGMSVDLTHALDYWPIIVAVAVVSMVAKVVVNLPMALASGFDLSSALRIGLGLSTLGEFSLILAASAIDHKVGDSTLSTVVVGAMLIVLVLTPLALHAVPALVRVLGRAPAPIRRPMRTLLGLAKRPTGKAGPAEVQLARERIRGHLRILAANLLLLVILGAVAAYLAQRSEDWRLLNRDYLGPIAVLGLAIAVATPFLWRGYRAYRDVVRVLLRVEDLPVGQVSVRHRLVDAWVAFTALLLLVPVTLFVPGTAPILLGALFLAISIAAVAWGQLNKVQRTLQGSVARVLGEETETGDLLDRILEKYPWGVRFAAVPIPPGSPVAGQSVERARIADLTGAAVAVLQRRHREIVNPAKDEMLLVGDTLILMGEPYQLARAEALIVAHGDALRLTAQSRVARVIEVDVAAVSPLVGQTLGQADLKNRTGTLVVGLRPADADHPLAFRPDIVLHPGDQLMLLGTPLQIERARLLCEGVPEGETKEERLAGSQDRPAGWGENA